MFVSIPTMSESASLPTYSFKVITVGNLSVGKSSILNRYFTDQFNQKIYSTIGVDTCQKRFKFSFDGTEVNLNVQFWDTTGEERYKSMLSSYYRGAHGAIVVYDVNDPHSFEACGEWITRIRSQTSSC